MTSKRMQKTVRFRSRRRRKEWSRLLSKWAELMDNLCALDRKDVPYWYGERTMTGLLAAAAWRLPGGGALEELGAQRGSLRRPRPGRIDGYIVFGKTFYQLEAKVVWPARSTGEGPEIAEKSVSRALAAARKQVRRVQKEYQGHVVLALCHVVPGIKVMGEGAESLPMLPVLYRRFVELKYPVVAMYRPPDEQLPWLTVATRRKKRSWHYPGVLRVGNRVW